MPQRLEEGLMVFVADGELGVGAVREIRPDASEFVVNIQNAGDHVLPFAAVRDIHSGKVMLDLDKLDAPLREALGHTHDAEFKQYAALQPDEDPRSPD